MDLYEAIKCGTLSFTLAVAALGCGFKAEAPPTTDASPPTVPAPEIPTAPVPDVAPTVRIAAVVWYHLDAACSGEVPLGLDGKGQRPDFARDDDGTLYAVTGVYDGAVYVKVGDQCLAGGDYDGYDLFTLDQPLRSR